MKPSRQAAGPVMEPGVRKLAICLAIALGLTLGLAACGSDSVVSSINGTAATGLAIANATVSIKDSRGRSTGATTDASGSFSFSPSGMTAPLMLQVDTAFGRLYAIVAGNELAKHINLTPFSHAIAKMALGAADDAAMDDSFANARFGSMGVSAMALADTRFRQLLRDELGTLEGVSDDATNLRFAEFTPASAGHDGDELDRLLTLFKPEVQGNQFVGFNIQPEFVRDIVVTDYDGVTDDLLTAGLGAAGLAAGTPAYASASPSAAELRRNAIYANYRAVLDINANSGYGTMYGPNVDKNGVIVPVSATVGLVAGREYIAYADDGSGLKNVTLLVQIPASFDTLHPCIVTGTSSGSRGIYGAIGSAGEWGLKNGCAVAYTDKGSGTGLYTFDTDQVNLRDGTRALRTVAGADAIFTPALSPAERVAYNVNFPGRLAFKHAHSQQNPEKDWGKNTLQAASFAFYALNEEYGASVPGRSAKRRTITPANTVVIASSISNGAGAALLAAEQDRLGLIKGVAANEPQVQSAGASGFTVNQGGVPVSAQAKALYDYSSFAALYEPCLGATAINTTPANRCNSLQAKGLLSGSPAVDANSLGVLQADARSRMHAYGWLADSDVLLNSPALTAVPVYSNSIYVSWSNLMVAATYAYTYGRFAATDHVCGFSFSNVDSAGLPVPFGALEPASFATQNGIVGSLVYENAVGGAKVFALAASPSTGVQDQSLDGFLCLRALATGVDTVTGAPLTGTLAAQSQRVRDGMAAVQASGNLRGKPAVIVQGRADTLIPVNHASRAYLGLNAKAEGRNSQLRYIEVTNANHFDANANTMPTSIVPLHLYLFRALDAVYAKLTSATDLPPSQVVRTTPRAVGNTAVITNINIPPIAATPAPADRITVNGSSVNIPN